MDEKLENFADGIEELADEIGAVMSAHDGDEISLNIYHDHNLFDLDDYTLDRIRIWLEGEVAERRGRSASK